MHVRLAAIVAFVLAVGVVAPAQRFENLSAAASRARGQQPPAPAPAPTPVEGQPPQEPPRPAQPPVIRSGINFVSVDVIVTDKKTGEVVLNMKKDDFEVREDRKPQQVQTFDVVKIDPVLGDARPPREIRTTYDEEQEARQPNVRLFVILLDDYHVRRGNDLVVRAPLVDFIQNQLAPQDMVAIMYPLTPVSDLAFTRNRESLIGAINHFLGRKGDYEPRNEFEERYAYYPAATVEDIRNDVTMGALKGAAVRLGGMRDGRKSIIWVSEGFVSHLPAQVSDPIAALPRVGNRASPGVDPQLDPRAQAQQFFDQADLVGRLKQVYDTANRNNASVYAVDPRGLAAMEYGVEQGVSLTSDKASLTESLDTLRVIADNTDGRAIINRNDLAAGMKQIMRDASGYYLLGYTSAATPTDGRFHTIDVHVKRPGVEVRARKGYWAYTSEDAARASAPATPTAPSPVSNALNKIAEPARGDRAARFWVGTERSSTGQPRITVAWEPLTAQEGARASDVASRVVLTALAPDGRPLFRGRVPDAASATDGDGSPPAPAQTNGNGGGSPTGAATAVSPHGAAVSFDAPPGPVELRMVVEGGRGQVIDSTESTVTVPDYAQAPVAFGTPRLYRARTAREMLQYRNNPDAVPTAAREFSRTERLLIRFDAYAAGGGRPAVTARLLNRGGQSMADIPVQATDGKPYQIDFPLAPLAAGEYVIEVNAKAAAGAAQQLIAFRITG